MATQRKWIEDENGVHKTPEAYLLDVMQSIIDEHDKQADADVPPIAGEDGHMTCGCWTCGKLKDAIEAVGSYAP